MSLVVITAKFLFHNAQILHRQQYYTITYQWAILLYIEPAYSFNTPANYCLIFVNPFDAAFSTWPI